MAETGLHIWTRKDGILGPWQQTEARQQSIKVDGGKLGDFGLSWEPITHPFTMVDHSHHHAYAQILCFVGANPNDLFDFDAEIELSLDHNPHIITETSFIYIPGGMSHCPLTYKRVGKPFLFNNLYFIADYKSIKD
jgi:hypothetical protein